MFEPEFELPDAEALPHGVVHKAWEVQAVRGDERHPVIAAPLETDHNDPLAEQDAGDWIA